MKKFGQKLRTLRTRRGLTLRQLSDQLGVGYSYIGKMERGEREPNVAMLVKIADLFEVSLDRLIRDDLEVDG
ncbi:MAG: helix-turn-helix domain-containing protein [Gammaproteobacteria bacterium]|nr:helix-turn-helix domain-containing protein [Gammaproteobacteria bacterium]NIW96990.1 helix-turn-helix domain-containing protein [Phycisphaerae bacterium]